MRGEPPLVEEEEFEGKLATGALPAKLIGSAFARPYTGTDRSRKRTYAFSN